MVRGMSHDPNAEPYANDAKALFGLLIALVAIGAITMFVLL